MSAFHLTIKGKVQGVFYRQSAKEIATKLGLKGWIKNNADGSVVCLVSGEEEHLQQFITWCKQGPPQAYVTDIILKEHEEKSFSNFTILHT